MQREQVQEHPGSFLYTIKSMSSSGTELQFWLEQPGPDADAALLLRTHQPRQPQAPVHQGRLTLTAFEALTRSLLASGGARPTLDLTGGQVKLHLTTRSRRPGRLSVRPDESAEVLNFSLLNPVAEEFQKVLVLAQERGSWRFTGH